MARYKKNFLTQVIVRIDFPFPLAGIRSRLNQDFVKKIIRFYPIQEPPKVIGISFQLGKGRREKTKRERTNWFFYSKNREEKLCISETYMYIDVHEYKSFKELHSHFIYALESLFASYRNVSVNRLGLRYINHIERNEVNPTDWKGYLNTDLLSIFKVADSKEATSRAFHMLEMNYDNMNLRFQYGMPNPDYPAPIRKKVFVLDFDAYLRSDQNKDEIIQNLDSFHRKIESYFERSILKKTREMLNG